MRLDSSGNLGLGVTPSGSYKLEINGAASVFSSTTTGDYTTNQATNPFPAGQRVRFENLQTTTNTYTGIEFAPTNTGAQNQISYIGSVSTASGLAGDLVFGRRTGTTAYTESMRLDASGNLGIGTGSPTQKLDVNGTAKATTFSGSASGLTGLPLSTGVSGTLPIANGGTGSTSTAYCALGSNVSGTLPIANGGTNATTAPDARTSLGAAASGAITASGLTQATARLLGRTTAGTGAPEEISVGGNLTLSAGSLNLATNPALGSATATTQAAGTNGTGVATTAFVQNRAWVRFDGTLAAASMIKASWNVSSITDNGTGDYTLNFGTAMADANFCAVVSINNVSGGGSLVQPYVVTPSLASNVQIITLQNSGGSPADTAGTHVAVFR